MLVPNRTIDFVVEFGHKILKQTNQTKKSTPLAPYGECPHDMGFLSHATHQPPGDTRHPRVPTCHSASCRRQWTSDLLVLLFSFHLRCHRIPIIWSFLVSWRSVWTSHGRHMLKIHVFDVFDSFFMSSPGTWNIPKPCHPSKRNQQKSKGNIQQMHLQPPTLGCFHNGTPGGTVQGNTSAAVTFRHQLFWPWTD